MNNNSDDNIWDWQNEDYGLQTNTTRSLWSNANENQGDLSYVLNTTPTKSFWDYLDQQHTNYENINKETETCRESYSQAKRRKMLHFEDEIFGVDVMPHCHEDLTYVYLVREASLDEALPNITQWVNGFADDTPGTGNEGLDLLDRSSDEWLTDCLINETQMHLNVDDLKRAFVKPCDMEGTVTLKDKNQEILTLSPWKSRKNDKNVTKSYPTSSFSGKPVVCKTKIRTKGGKGSITIMRTKE
ncbi:protein XRI1-like [Bidens hawaiensis]|uniref:protein XRI1-like n=1 Tax=Bidens hawaiensis TaxID=980011 RepID=UPI00404B9223